MGSLSTLVSATRLYLAHLSKVPEFTKAKELEVSIRIVFISFPLFIMQAVSSYKLCVGVWVCAHAGVCTLLLTDYLLSPWQCLIDTKHLLKVSSHCCHPPCLGVGGQCEEDHAGCSLLSGYLQSPSHCLPHPLPSPYLPQHLGGVPGVLKSLF